MALGKKAITVKCAVKSISLQEMANTLSEWAQLFMMLILLFDLFCATKTKSEFVKLQIASN